MSSTAHSTTCDSISLTNLSSRGRILTPRLIIQAVTQNRWTANDQVVLILHVNIRVVDLDLVGPRWWRTIIGPVEEIDSMGITQTFVGCSD